MAPEQLCGALNAEPRSDIFSVGASLYELLSGRLPFDGVSCVEVYTAIMSAPPRLLHELDPRIPPRIDAVVQRCLAKERLDRYANVGELADALLPFAPPRARSYRNRIARILGLEPVPFGDRQIEEGPSKAAVTVGESAVPQGGETAGTSVPPGPVVMECSPPVPRHATRRHRVLGASAGLLVACIASAALFGAQPVSTWHRAPAAAAPKSASQLLAKRRTFVLESIPISALAVAKPSRAGPLQRAIAAAPGSAEATPTASPNPYDVRK